MKQQYTIVRDDGKAELVISEFAELDKDSFSLLCEQRYPAGTIEAALKKGKESLILTIRTLNLYPPGAYAARIADAIADLYENSEEKNRIEITLDDLIELGRGEEIEEIEEEEDIEEEEEEEEDIDELLDEDLDDEFDETESIDPINSPLQIADDDSLDGDDDT